MTTIAFPPVDSAVARQRQRRAADAGSPAIPKRIVAATVAGNALEFYDFVTYAFFAVYIGRAFFPASTPLGSLLLSVAVFGVGFVSRPLGGVLIGAYADRAGRKPAMLLTIALITVGTLGMALTPSFASIGMAAPVIVVLCRLVQGLALGGEVGPSSAFLIESAPPSQRGLYASWQLASQGVATLVAGLLGMLMIGMLTPDELQAWGWRVPFAAGLLLVPVAFYLRRAMSETLHAPITHDAGSVGLKGLLRQKRIIMLAVLVIMGGTVSNYVGNYMTTYAITTLKFSPLIAMGATVMVGVATLVFALLGGWLCDRYGRKPVMLWPRAATALLAVPAFMLLINHPQPGHAAVRDDGSGGDDGRQRRGFAGGDSGTAAAPDPGHRPLHRLCRGRFAVRRHHAVHRDLAHRRHGQPGRTGLVCGGVERDHRSGHLGPARKP